MLAFRQSDGAKSAHNAVLEKLKGPKGCYRILLYICEKERAMITQVMKDIPLSKATITKNVQWLKDMKLIHEEKIVGFPTRKILSLTREGRDLIPQTNHVLGDERPKEERLSS